MNVTLSLDEELVRRVRKIAEQRDTTLTGMVREYLEKVAGEGGGSERQRRDVERLKRSFEKLQVRIDKRTWTRADLHERR